MAGYFDQDYGVSPLANTSRSNEYAKGIGDTTRDNADALNQGLMAGAQGYSNLLQAKEMAKAYKASAKAKSQGSGIGGNLISGLVGLANPFAGALAKQMFPGPKA